MKFEYCIPTYNGEDNWHYVDAFDAEGAAIKAAKNYNEDGDYTLMDSHEYVLIREAGEESTVRLYSMRAEPDIYYSADEVSDPKCEECGKDLTQVIKAGELHENDGHEFCSRECSKKWWEKYYAKMKKSMESL